MRNFQQIGTGVDVLPLLHAIQRQPQLWNQQRFRTTYDNTPHADVDDIWLRFSPERAGFDQVIEDTSPIWQPAASGLPQAKPLVLNLMSYLGAYELGRLLITRLRPGGRILPHADTDGAYVNQGDIGRYHIVLQGLPGSTFRCGDEVVQMLTGEIWWFDAGVCHSVENNSADDRIHLIADFRLWA
jgi:Aspartyl/Asparaginyl beta-hydroxylase